MSNVYYWYHHCSFNKKHTIKIKGIKIKIEDIKECILKHDWLNFQFYQFLLNRVYCSNKFESHLLFLPNISKKDFMKITKTECECG